MPSCIKTHLSSQLGFFITLLFSLLYYSHCTKKNNVKFGRKLVLILAVIIEIKNKFFNSSMVLMGSTLGIFEILALAFWLVDS